MGKFASIFTLYELRAMVKMYVLPVEVLYRIVLELPYADIINYSLTSSTMYSLCQDNILWKQIYYRDYGVSSTTRPIRSWQTLYEHHVPRMYSLLYTVDMAGRPQHLGAYRTYMEAIKALVDDIMTRGARLGLPIIGGYTPEQLDKLNHIIKALYIDHTSLHSTVDTQLASYRDTLTCDVEKEYMIWSCYISCCPYDNVRHRYHYYVREHRLL